MELAAAGRENQPFISLARFSPLAFPTFQSASQVAGVPRQRDPRESLTIAKISNGGKVNFTATSSRLNYEIQQRRVMTPIRLFLDLSRGMTKQKYREKWSGSAPNKIQSC